MNLFLKWFTFSLKSHKVPQEGLVLMGVLTLTVVPAQVYLGRGVQSTGFSCKEQRHSLSFQVVDKKMGLGTEWLRMCHWGCQWEPWESVMGVFTSWSGVLSIIVCYVVCLRSYILMHTAEYFGGNFVKVFKLLEPKNIDPKLIRFSLAGCGSVVELRPKNQEIIGQVRAHYPGCGFDP